MSEPVFVGLLFADRVIEEVGHKKGIIGTFTAFNSPQYPVMFPPWFIYAAVTNLDPGSKHSFAINLSSKDTQIVLFSVGGETEVEELATVAEFFVPIQVVFPQAGVFVVSFVVDGREIATRIIAAKLIPQIGGVPG